MHDERGRYRSSGECYRVVAGCPVSFIGHSKVLPPPLPFLGFRAGHDGSTNENDRAVDGYRVPFRLIRPGTWSPRWDYVLVGFSESVTEFYRALARKRRQQKLGRDNESCFALNSTRFGLERGPETASSFLPCFPFATEFFHTRSQYQPGRGSDGIPNFDSLLERGLETVTTVSFLRFHRLSQSAPGHRERHSGRLSRQQSGRPATIGSITHTHTHARTHTHSHTDTQTTVLGPV